MSSEAGDVAIETTMLPPARGATSSKPRAARRRQPDTTRAALVSAAREQFSEKGYAATTTEDIVVTAGVTRGALYHHFTGKEELFRAVVEVVIEEAVDGISPSRSETAPGPTPPPDGVLPWRVTIEGMLAYLDACLERDRATILLVDGPTVLGLVAVVEVAERSLGSLWAQVLDRAMTNQSIDVLPVQALGHLLAAAVSEGAMYVWQSDDRALARDDVRLVLQRLMEGLQPR